MAFLLGALRITTSSGSGAEEKKEKTSKSQSPRESADDIPPAPEGPEENLTGKELQKYQKERKKQADILKKEVKKRKNLQVVGFDRNSNLGLHNGNPIFSKSGTIEVHCANNNTKKKEYYLLNNYDEMPEAVRKSITHMRLTKEEVETHFELILKIMSFFYKVYLLTDKMLEDLKKKQGSRIVKINMPVQMNEREVLDSFYTIDRACKLYKVNEALGEGAFGQVYRARNMARKDIPKHIAMKIMQHSEEKTKRYNLTEVYYLKKAAHPNVVKLYESIRVGDEVWLVMEYIDGRDLKKVSAVSKGVLKEDQIAFVAKELLTALAYLHGQGIVHRDLKNLNIMMSAHGEVKIIDFGLATEISTGPLLSMVGSPFWMAPEMIKGLEYTTTVDIWSFGVCMLELANHCPPNEENPKLALYKTATVGVGPNFGLHEPAQWSAAFKNFLSHLQKIDPAERGTAAALLKHEFVTGAASVSVMKEVLGSLLSAEINHKFGQSGIM